jgi:hypothetical protein
MSNNLPKSIEALINAAFLEMQADPKHHLTHRRRREIYDAIRAETDENGRNVLGWLAVLTSKRVLPKFEGLFPEETLPRELLDAAVGVLRGQVDDEYAKEIQDLGYHASGHSWGYDEEEMPWNTDMAAATAYRALMETLGHEPLQNLDRSFILGTIEMNTGNMTEYSEPMPGEQFTDEELCTDVNSDTAAPAAVASSCGEEGPWCDPEKLYMFWVWWLKEAIPDAWETAHREQIV